jgi:hypothetical protein
MPFPRLSTFHQILAFLCGLEIIRNQFFWFGHQDRSALAASLQHSRPLALSFPSAWPLPSTWLNAIGTSPIVGMPFPSTGMMIISQTAGEFFFSRLAC